MFRLSELVLLFGVVLVCLYWINAQRIKELVLSAVQAHCNKMGVQLLDDSVVLKRLWLKRDARGQMRLWRLFQFEFSSTGDERYLGSIEILGRQIQNPRLAPHRMG